MNKHHIAVVLMLVLTVGCNRSKTISTANGDVKVEENGKSGQSTVTVTGQDGAKMTIASQGAKIPDDYPKDAPVASGKVVMVTSVDNGDSNGSSMVLESSDNCEKTIAFYKKGLSDNGWTVSATIATEQMTMLTATKDTRQMVVQIADSDGKCSVTQHVGTKK